MTRLESFVQDLRFGARMLVRSPGFTLAALVTLALGIGANTAIFSVVDAVLLRALPYPEPERLVELVRRSAGDVSDRHTGRRYLFFRDHLRTVSAISARRDPTGFNMFNMATGDTAAYVSAMPVSKEYFAVLGVAPVHGTVFGEEHDRSGGPLAAVLGHALWRQRFNSDPAAVGTTISLGGTDYTIAGVMPESFTTIPRADLFIPLRPDTTGPGGGYNYHVMARIAPGTTIDHANADAASVWAALRAEFPGEIRQGEVAGTLEPYQQSVSRDSRSLLLIIWGAVALVLLIACANTASLLLARATSRGREIAVRSALGAARGRIVRQLLTESVLLSLSGAALGVAVAYAALPLLLTLLPSVVAIPQEVVIDRRVLLATFAVAVGTGVLFGLAPAASLSRTDLAAAFRYDGTRTMGGPRSAILRSTLVVAEIALCMLLLVGAGLLLQTFVRLRAVDPGFDPRGVVRARMSLQGGRYASAADANRFFAQGLDRLRAIPGVRGAAVVNGVPIERGLNLGVEVLDGPAPPQKRYVEWRYASADYFSVMGIPIVAGRAFTEGDRAGAPPIAVVNEAFVRLYLKGTTGLGYHIRVYDSDGSIEIVGIARDVREGGLKSRIPPLMYVPVTQANEAGIRSAHTYFPMSWVVRTTAGAPNLEASMRDAIRAVDPRQPFSSFATMDEVKANAFASERRQMSLLGGLAAIGLLLAAAGVYGLIAYTVAQRTREIGLRVALGATRGRILRSIVVNGALTASAGIVVGLIASVAFARTLDSVVWGVTTVHIPTLAAVATVLLLVSMLATVVPAIRATRLNPIAALRE
jgi:putative ABC transport system permease protein